MSMIEELKTYQINTDEALERFMGNAVLYEHMLKKLPESVKSSNVRDNIKSGNYDAAFEAAHTLKGITGNLSLTPLYNAYTEISQLLRENNPRKALDILEGILPTQTSIIECINKYL